MRILLRHDNGQEHPCETTEEAIAYIQAHATDKLTFFGTLKEYSQVSAAAIESDPKAEELEEEIARQRVAKGQAWITSGGDYGEMDSYSYAIEDRYRNLLNRRREERLPYGGYPPGTF